MTAREPVTQLSDLSGVHPEWEQLRVPLAGDPNAAVRIGVVDVASGAKRWLDLGHHGRLLHPAHLLDEQSRHARRRHAQPSAEQARSLLLRCEHRRAAARDAAIRRRHGSTCTTSTPGSTTCSSFPAGSHEFFCISDRDGWQHVYRYDYSGKLIKQVTHGNWSVTRIERIDAPHGIVYYTRTQAVAAAAAALLGAH